MDLGNGVLCAPVRAEPVRARLEIRLEDGFEHQFQAGLDHAVGDGGNTQFPEFPVPLGIITCRTSAGRNPPDFSESRIWPRNAAAALAGFDLGHGDHVDPRSPRPLLADTRSKRDQERRVIDEVEQVTEPAERSAPAQRCNLACILRTATQAHQGAAIHGAGIPRRIFGHYIPSLTDTLPPFPMHAAFPRSEYYGGSAPPAPSAGVAPIPPAPRPDAERGSHTDGSHVHCLRSTG